MISRRLSVFKGKSPPSTSPPPSATTRDLAQFLDYQKVNYRRALELHQARQWSVVMGNEAGDLDSLASAIAYAWYATNHLQQLTIPLVQIERDDFVLRAENLHALERAGIDPTILLTADEIPLPSGETYALVDHNKLDARFAHVSRPNASGSSLGHGSSPSTPAPGSPFGAESKVVAIVDHHADEGAHLDAKPRIVESAGSCASLVTRLFTAIPNYTIPPELALLLLSAITIDTNGLKEGGKALQVDRDAADWLLPQANLDESFTIASNDKDGNNRAVRELNDILQSKKNDVAHLDTRDLLRRDYKEYMLSPAWAPETTFRAGLATVPRGLKGWLEDLRPSTAGTNPKGKLKSSPDFWDACVAYMDERGLDALGVLTTWRDDGRIGQRGKSRREQAWLVRAASDSDELPRRLWSGLEESKVLKVKRKDGKRYGWSREGWVARVYEQGDASATRKATAPLLRDIVEGPKAGL
ncbi:DHH phosphoesterase [Peniophora sp. CONT]|nr:DHH phosphoesterase [Peniophora sp. CONT]